MCRMQNKRKRSSRSQNRSPQYIRKLKLGIFYFLDSDFNKGSKKLQNTQQQNLVIHNYFFPYKLMKQIFKFSAALLEKESRAFSIIFQKSFRTEMEYISNGKIKVTVFHPRMHKVKERNYFFFQKCFDPDYLYIGRLNFCQVA